jgi:hypothetical protein
MFLKPGKQNIFVFHGDRTYYSGHLVFCREEAIPGFAKEMKAGRKKREYNHALSVFATWKPASAETIEKCLEHD